MHATLVVLAVMSAAPDGLRAATLALDDLKYDVALKSLPDESAIKGYRREEVIEWFATRSLALLGLKREAEASDSFRRLLAIAPEWVLPDQYGPRVSTLVSSLRAEAARSGTLSLRFEGGLLRTTVDGVGLAKEVEVSWREPGGPVKTTSLSTADRQPAPWPRETRLEVWARLTGLHGSTLFEWGTENAPTRLEPMKVVSVDAPAAAKAASIWGPVGIGAGAAAVLAAGLGVGFAVGSQDAQKAAANATRDASGRITSLTQRDAFALDARAKGDVGAASAFFVSAAVLAAAGAGLIIFDRVRAVPGPGGAALVVPLDAHFGLAGVEGGR